MTDTCTWRGISWALLRDNKKHFWLYGSATKNEYFRVQVDPSAEHTPIQTVVADNIRAFLREVPESRLASLPYPAEILSIPDDVAYAAAVVAYEANK